MGRKLEKKNKKNTETKDQKTADPNTMNTNMHKPVRGLPNQ